MVHYGAPWQYSGPSLTNWQLTGVTDDNSDAGVLYVQYVIAAVVPDQLTSVALYKDAARTEGVAAFSFIGPSLLGTTVALEEAGGSGISGTVFLAADASLEEEELQGTVFVADTCGREPIGLAQQGKWNYPLVNPSSEIEYLLADAYLIYEDPADYDVTLEPLAGPFKIDWLYGLGESINMKPSWAPTPTHSVDVLICDRNNRPAFNSTLGTLTERAWGPRLHLYQWEVGSSILRLVVHTAWPPPPLEPRQRAYKLHLVPSNGILDEQAVVRMPKRIKEVTVGLTTITTGDLEFEAGYNIALTDEGPIGQVQFLEEAIEPLLGERIGGGRRGRRFEIDGTPGGGPLGRFPGCDDLDITIKRINGVVPNAYGDFIVTTDDPARLSCYWLERPTNVVAESNPRIVRIEQNTLQVNNDCDPCCDCPDYVEVKKAIDALWDRWRQLGMDAEDIRDLYALNRERWLEQKECREARPQVMFLNSSCDGFVGISYSYCHMADECAGQLETTFLFEGFRSDPTGPFAFTHDYDFVPSRTKKNEGSGDNRLRPYQMDGTLPELKATWEGLDGHKSAKLTLMMHICNAIDGDSLRVTATPRLDGVEGNPLTETVSLIPLCINDDPCA